MGYIQNILYENPAIKCVEITFPGTPTKNHSLELAFTGSANVVLNGSFFYYNQVGVVKMSGSTFKCSLLANGQLMDWTN